MTLNSGNPYQRRLVSQTGWNITLLSPGISPFFSDEIHVGYEAAIIEVKKMLNKFGGQLRHE
jgi:hypothetical protein